MGTDVTFDRLLLESTDLLFQGDLVKAQAKINKALARKSGEPRALGILAGILSAQEDHAGAAAIYRNLLGQFGDEPTLHFKLAMECFALGDLNVGYEEISEAVACDPDNPLLQKFKKHVAQAMGLIKDFDQDPAELPDDLYKTIIRIYGKSEHQSGPIVTPGPELGADTTEKKITKEQKKKKKAPPPQKEESQEEGDEYTPVGVPLDEDVLGAAKMRKHNNPTGKYKKAELRDSIGAENSAGNRYVISAAEGIYALEPSKIESLAFSREFLMFPLNVGWYFRENLWPCS